MPTVLFCAGLLVVVLMGGLLVGCQPAPSYPTTNINGDHNTVVNAADESSGNTVTTPAPVVVPPVVLTTPPEETQ